MAIVLDMFSITNFVHDKSQGKGNVSGHVQHVYFNSIGVWLI